MVKNFIRVNAILVETLFLRNIRKNSKIQITFPLARYKTLASLKKINQKLKVKKKQGDKKWENKSWSKEGAHQSSKCNPVYLPGS